MPPKPSRKVAEQAGAWFWKRLDQASADFEALPPWMKKEEADKEETTKPKRRAA